MDKDNSVHEEFCRFHPSQLIDEGVVDESKSDESETDEDEIE